MPNYKIRGIDVDFPYEAYDCQIAYMEKIIQSLQQGCNALLESPTGTGKTLCLLCATLAWRKTFGDFSRNSNEEGRRFSSSQMSGSQPSENRQCEPVIIYASRTHSQLKQVIRELKTSNYRPRMTTLGSREQLCIHDEVRLLRGRAQNNACRYLCKKRMCTHQIGVPEYMKKSHELGEEPFDIEDLLELGRSKGLCPYYISRELHKVVDIIFAPYNYLIDPGNRRSLSGIQWSNAVLIFDEGHNLESICADAASFDLPSGLLTACISEAKQCVDLCIQRKIIEKSDEKQFNPENYAILRALLLKLEAHIAEVTIESRELGFTRSGDYIYEFLSDLNITFETANMLVDTIDNAALLLEGNTSEVGTKAKTKGTFSRLESIRNVLNLIFRDGGKDHARFYCFHVQEFLPGITNSFKVSRTLSWWCFNPGLAMQEFSRLGLRSVILTSGTLSPLDSIALELNLEFPVRLENPHVISANQIWVGVVPSGPSNHPFNSSYRNRDSLEYKQELGNAIVNFARIVPDGLLVFFPSYYMMDQCIECWKDMGHARSRDFCTIWERICKHKHPVVEPRQSSLFTNAIEDFQFKLHDKTTTGAVFFAVCRGKVSEGLDFADQAGRAVIVTGLPFSTKTDPQVRLKRDYLDRQAFSEKKGAKVLTGEEWYVQQAARAVNQAVGRVIRHRHDYGAIIFCDQRFAVKNWEQQMSYWLRPHVKCYSNFGDAVFTLTKFFRDTGIHALKPKLVESFTRDRALRLEENFSLKPLTPLVHSSEHCSNKPMSSYVLPIFEQVVPANRATHPKKLDSISSMHIMSQTKKITGITQCQNNAVIDLEKDTLLSEQVCKDSQGAPTAKRPKFEVDPEWQKDTSSKRFVDFEISRLREVHAQVEDQPKSTSMEKQNKSTMTDGTSVRDYLSQVQEKLTVAEYKEFIDLMEALKSKKIKTIHLLESIAKLFSSPGRYCLLSRFKDFVPTKFHTIYDQLLGNYGAKVDTSELNPEA
ncbi:regulator of telomere elongation helicase 1 homolog isoform X1 [Zingiber officinale]|uniref:regulator of telomere elongation helicase 1 homolog isoform X1 n=1 Tax=Zingiber officinale TaxID=94328 RepID=UPI001C4BFDE9|nr:regulator of telomere elongation helicase 1 homolog isoform X1 [Zingiber officinale]